MIFSFRFSYINYLIYSLTFNIGGIKFIEIWQNDHFDHCQMYLVCVEVNLYEYTCVFCFTTIEANIAKKQHHFYFVKSQYVVQTLQEHTPLLHKQHWVVPRHGSS